MSGISREEIARIASLARLAVSESEAERLAHELGTILAYVEELQAVDTDGVEPTAHVIPMQTPLREDRAEAPLDPEQALANAPEREGTAFRVPRVIEGVEG